MKIFNLFIGRLRTYFNAYRDMSRSPDKRPYFRFGNCSVPRRPRDVIPVLAAVYSGCGEWAGKETEIAKRRFSAEKPIVVVRPRGSGRISTLIIVSATRRLA